MLSNGDSQDLTMEALELRNALEVQLERARSLTFDEQLELCVEEQLSELVLLVSQYSEEVVQKAMLMTTVSHDDDPTYTGRYPLNLACDTNSPVEIIEFFLRNDPTESSVHHKDKWGDLPIHTACSRQNYTEVVKLLLHSESSKSTIFTARVDGSLAIHTACRYNAPPRVIMMLLEHDLERKSLFVESLFAQLPIHVACRCNLNPDSLQLLLDYDTDKKSLLYRDNADRLPIHVAFLYKCHERSIRLLLFAMIHGRMERVGLENWKQELRTFIQRLDVRERDFNASDKLEITRSVLDTFIERAIVLELGIWKASCCRHGGDELHMASCLAGLDTDTKHACRIKSGAEVIVPGVLSFLEDEPIEAVLKASQ